MDPKLLLVKLATLLFNEGQLKDPTIHSVNLVQEVLETIKFGEPGVDFDRSREILLNLKRTVEWMAERAPGEELDRTIVLQRIRVNSSDEEGLYYGFEQGIGDTSDLIVLKKRCMAQRMELRDYVNQTKIKEILKEFSYKANFNPEKVNWSSLISEVHEKLDPYRNNTSEEFKIGGMIDMVDLSDGDNISRLINRAGEETSLEGVLRLGWQAINRMLGEHQGLRRGEFVLIGALQHNFKTGFTLHLFRQIALYNTPYMRDPTKKPLLLHISAENELQLNIVQLYRYLYENETGQLAPTAMFSDPDPLIKQAAIDEAKAYIYEKMSVNGYNVMMGRCDPSEMTYERIFDMITALESQGYEIHAIVFDYLNMISKRGCIQGGPTGSEIRDLFRRVRNFTAPRGITFITPAQLSTEAKKMTRLGVNDFVKHLEGKGYYDSCGTIDQEVDLEIFIHKEVINQESFLTIQRGKHRKPRDTPIRHRYTVLPFSPIADIRDDYGKADISLKAPGGGPMGSGEEIPWHAPGGVTAGLPL